MDYISASEAAKSGEFQRGECKNFVKKIEDRKISIEEIVEKYSTYIYNIAYKLTGKTEQAEDITQETFIKAWKHLDELKEQTALKQWLHTICINEFRMSLRKDIRQKTTYVDNIEELEKDGELLVNPRKMLLKKYRQVKML